MASTGDDVTAEQLGALKDFLGICMTRWVEMLSALLGRKTFFTLQSIGLMKTTGALPPMEIPYISVGIEFTKGISGKSLMVYEGYSALVITDILIGGAGRIELDKPGSLILRNAHFSAMSELTRHLINYAADVMAKSSKGDLLVPELLSAQLTADSTDNIAGFLQETPVINITYEMEIEGLLKCGLTQFLTASLAEAICRSAAD